MISREDFIFTIGYDGENAVVDKSAKKQYGKYTTLQLLDAGLYKPALCSAVFAGSDEEVEEIRRVFSRITGTDIAGIDQLKLVLGVQSIPEKISKITLI